MDNRRPLLGIEKKCLICYSNGFPGGLGSVIKVSDLYGMFHVVKQTVKIIAIPIIKLKEISLVEINLMYGIIWGASIFIFGKFNQIQGLCYGRA